MLLMLTACLYPSTTVPLSEIEDRHLWIFAVSEDEAYLYLRWPRKKNPVCTRISRALEPQLERSVLRSKHRGGSRLKPGDITGIPIRSCWDRALFKFRFDESAASAQTLTAQLTEDIRVALTAERLAAVGRCRLIAPGPLQHGARVHLRCAPHHIATIPRVLFHPAGGGVHYPEGNSVRFEEDRFSFVVPKTWPATTGELSHSVRFNAKVLACEGAVQCSAAGLSIVDGRLPVAVAP